MIKTRASISTVVLLALSLLMSPYAHGQGTPATPLSILAPAGSYSVFAPTPVVIEYRGRLGQVHLEDRADPDASTNANTNTNADTNADADTYTNAHTNAYTDANTNTSRTETT